MKKLILAVVITFAIIGGSMMLTAFAAHQAVACTGSCD